MSEPIQCPLCLWTCTRPEPDVPSYQLAGALGFPQGALIEIARYQVAAAVEEQLTHHLAEHGPRDWLPALMATRADLDRQRDVITELRATIATQDTIRERLTAEVAQAQRTAGP